MTDGGTSSFVYVTYIQHDARAFVVRADKSGIRARVLARGLPGLPIGGGGSWKLMFPDGRAADAGEIVAFEPGKRLGIRWRNEFKPELKAEGWSLLHHGDSSPLTRAVKLTVTHSMSAKNSKFIDAVSRGWPQILSKSQIAPRNRLRRSSEQGGATVMGLAVSGTRCRRSQTYLPRPPRPHGLFVRGGIVKGQ